MGTSRCHICYDKTIMEYKTSNFKASYLYSKFHHKIYLYCSLQLHIEVDIQWTLQEYDKSINFNKSTNSVTYYHANA